MYERDALEGMQSGEVHEVQREKPQRQKGENAHAGTHSFSKKVSVFFYCFAIFILPFIFLPFAGLSVGSSKILFVAFLMCVSGIAYMYSVQRDVIRIPIILFTLLGALLVLVFLSTIFSESFNASFVGSLQGGTFYALFFGVITALLGSLIISTPNRFIAFFGSFLSGVGVVTLFHITRLVLGPEVLTFGIFQDPTATPVGSWYDLGMISGLVYLVALSSLVFGSLPTQLNSIFTVILCVALFFLALIHFNVLLIILAVLSLGMFLLALREKVTSGRIVSILSLFILVGTIMLSGPLGSLTEKLFDTGYIEVRPSMRSTTEVVSKNITDLKVFLLGNGPNTFLYLWQDDRNSEVIESDFWTVDFAFGASTFLTYILTIGVLSVIVFLAWLGYLIFLTVNSGKENVSNAFYALIIRTSSLIGICILLFGMFYVFGIIQFFLLCAFSGVAAGAHVLSGRAKVTSVRLSSENGTYIFSIAMTIFVVATLHVLATTTSRALYGSALKESEIIRDASNFASIDSKLALAATLERSDVLSRMRSELTLREAQSYLALSAEEITDIERERFNEALVRAQEFAVKATRIDPRNYRNWVTKGLILETLGALKVEGAFDETAKAYAEARKEHPTNPEIVLMQARLEEARGNTTAALGYIRESIDMKRSYVDAYKLLARIERVHGSDAKAVAAFEEGVLVNPKDKELLYELGALNYTLKKYEKAVETFDKAILIDPTFANALYFRGLSKFYLNDRGSSLDDLQKVLETNQSNEDLKKIIANIRSGRDPFVGFERADDVSSSVTESLIHEESNEEGTQELDERDAVGRDLEVRTSDTSRDSELEENGSVSDIHPQEREELHR